MLMNEVSEIIILQQKLKQLVDISLFFSFFIVFFKWVHLNIEGCGRQNFQRPYDFLAPGVLTFS